MRDAAKARTQRSTAALHAFVKNGQGKHVERIERFAHTATEPVHSPEHGAEYARSLLYFTQDLLGDKAAEELARSFDSEGVIWRHNDQVHAAQKQIGRLRSDAVRGGHAAIPLNTLVYATDEGDFIGSSYEVIRDGTIAIKDSSTASPKVRVRVGRQTVEIDTTALRYVEAPMIRAR